MISAGGCDQKNHIRQHALSLLFYFHSSLHKDSEGAEEDHGVPVFVRDAFEVLHACEYLLVPEIVECMMSSAAVHFSAASAQVKEICSASMAGNNQPGQLVGSAVVGFD